MLEDWSWSLGRSKWVLKFRLTLDIPHGGPIPSQSDWYILAESIYPGGVIDIFPSKEKGLALTFPHQLYNGEGKKDEPWRAGKICVDSPLRIFGRRAHDLQPYTNEERLTWQVDRLKEWLIAAQKGELVQNGDPFELPDYPDLVGRLVFIETPKSFEDWNKCSESFGFAEVAEVAETQAVAVRSFSSSTQKLFDIEVREGLDSLKRERFTKCAWILTKTVVTLDPWKAPATWGELEEALATQGINLFDVLQQTIPRLPSEGTFLLIGFPIFRLVGGEADRLHWLAVQVPPPSSAAGFRKIRPSRWKGYRDLTFPSAARLRWMKTENWADEELGGRGRLASPLRELRTAILGCGALGSAVAELLVRGGMKDVTIMDGDLFETGNMIRHTLGMPQIGKSKAEALAERLRQVNPRVSVQSKNEAFRAIPKNQIPTLETAELLVDCTGADDTIMHLAASSWDSKIIFASLSLGFACKRLFCFSTTGTSFPKDEFFEAMLPWLERERQENTGTVLEGEGHGCWHPMMPGRADDIWLAASIAVKFLEQIVSELGVGTQLQVFERVVGKNGEFYGISRAPNSGP